eukprot:238162_1
MALCCIIAVAVSLTTFYQICIIDSSAWLNRLYKNLTMITMIIFTLSSIGDLIHSMVRYFSPDLQMSETGSIINSIVVNVLYLSGNVLFYILILLRIYIPFRLNKCLAYFLFVIIIISAILSVIYCVVIWYFYYDHDQYWIFLLVTLSSNDFILNVFIFSLFIYKMRKTVISIDPLKSEEALTKTNVMTSVIIKHCILFGIGIALNQGYFIIHLYETFTDKYAFLMYQCLGYSARAIQTVATVVVLCLVLRINYNKYICLCKSCHLSIGKCCFKRRKITLDNPYHLLQDL